jgi:hypothetical protein
MMDGLINLVWKGGDSSLATDKDRGMVLFDHESDFDD